MSPDILTLVAAVLAYDLAYEPVVDLAGGLEARDAWSLGLLSRNARSDTSEEKDMMLVVEQSGRRDLQIFLFRPLFNADNSSYARCADWRFLLLELRYTLRN